MMAKLACVKHSLPSLFADTVYTWQADSLKSILHREYFELFCLPELLRMCWIEKNPCLFIRLFVTLPHLSPAPSTDIESVRPG